MTKFHRQYMITMKDIIQEGHPILRTKCKELTFPLTDEDQFELDCMLQYLRNSQNPQIARRYHLRPGTGLSANQIGLNKRMFVARYVDEQVIHEYKFINPKIVSHSTNITFLPEGEGCLSVNRHVIGHVPRYEWIKVDAYNEFGERLVYSFKGYGSILMQHEIDHLNGIIFYDRINLTSPYLGF